uniref:Uncharacterized protein n=1 Tax=Plectus sambesii TaxID=2011161 RepID=A0A914WE68_9BILA
MGARGGRTTMGRRSEPPEAVQEEEEEEIWGASSALLVASDDAPLIRHCKSARPTTITNVVSEEAGVGLVGAAGAAADGECGLLFWKGLGGGYGALSDIDGLEFGLMAGVMSSRPAVIARRMGCFRPAWSGRALKRCADRQSDDLPAMPTPVFCRARP